MKDSSISWDQTFQMTIDHACHVLNCSPSKIDDYAKAGRIGVTGRGLMRRLITKDVVAITQELQPKIAPNQSLGEHPGCGACLQMCSTCRRIESRSSRPVLVTEQEALDILGSYPKGGLIAFLRKNDVFIDSKRKNHRISYADVCHLKHQRVLKGINVHEERRGIANALDQMIALRRQEMAELDTLLVQYSVGHEEPLFRWGRAVDMTSPPPDQYYVYHLCHPSGRPFYVGKGVRDRMYQHAKEALRGVDSYKCNLIRKLLKQGKQIYYRVVFVSPDEREAYEYEILEIARIGRKKLTNMTDGGYAKEEHERVFALNVPRDQLSYARYIQLVNVSNLAPDGRKWSIYNWATERIHKLEGLLRDAYGLSHDDAVRKLESEINAISCYTAHQRSFADLEEYRHRRYSFWSHAD